MTDMICVTCGSAWLRYEVLLQRYNTYWRCNSNNFNRFVPLYYSFKVFLQFFFVFATSKYQDEWGASYSAETRNYLVYNNC